MTVRLVFLHFKNLSVYTCDRLPLVACHVIVTSQDGGLAGELVLITFTAEWRALSDKL